MTKLVDGMTLFHGSYARVETIDLAMCRPGKDFGAGFYLTSSPEQARSFIQTSLRKARSQGDVPHNQSCGYVSSFVYRAPVNKIPCYEFETADMSWLWFIAQNRKRTMARALSGRLDPALSQAEIVVGKIANDTTNRVIAAYLEGLFGPVESEAATRIAISQLMPERLCDQFCFLIDKAVACLEFTGATRHGE